MSECVLCNSNKLEFKLYPSDNNEKNIYIYM